MPNLTIDPRKVVTTYNTSPQDPAERLNNLRARLLPYSVPDLIACAGALQLMPENADSTLRLEALAHVVASLSESEGKPHISRGNLKNICNGREQGLSWLASLEDPATELFTESFQFHSGTFVIFPGLAEEIGFIVRHIAAAIFLPTEPFGHEQFVNYTRQLLLGALLISDAVSKKAGLSRDMLPISEPGSGVSIPSRQQLESLKQAVSFTGTELEDLLGQYDLSLNILEPLITPVGTLSLGQYDPEEGPLLHAPIIMTSGRYVVALPGMLLPALRDQIIHTAIESGANTNLAARFNKAVWHTVTRSLFYMDNMPLPLATLELPTTLSVPWFRDGFFNLDSDKLLYVLLLTDPCDSGQQDHDVSVLQQITPVVLERVAQVQNHVFTQVKEVNEIVALILVQGMKRMHILDRAAPDSAQVEPLMLTMSAADLYTLAQVEPANKLALWKYARAVRTTAQATEMVAIGGELDRFHLFRSRNESFYLADDARPHVINISPGGSGKLRAEVAEKYDTHGVTTFDGRFIVQVMSLYGSREIPIYIPRRELLPSAPDRASRFVERLPIPIWVTGPTYSEIDEAHSQLHSRYNQFTEAVAYWLWQLTPQLSPVLEYVRTSFRQLHIELHLQPDPCWLTPETEPPSAPGEPINVSVDAEHGHISVVIHLAMSIAVEKPDNQAELHLMARILGALSTLMSARQAALLSQSAIEQMLAVHAATPHKKIILAVRSAMVPQLDPRGLPSWRKVADADEEELLDELGKYLSDVEHLPVELIPDNDRVPLLNKVVEFFYQKLVHEVATLNQDGLLEHILAQAEAVVYQKAQHDLLLPTRQVCFAAEGTLTNEFAEELQELAKAGLASRFLVEYIAASPPHGTRPVSLSVYDRLLALAWHITNYGFLCDLLRYGLADIKISMLPSGRLGLDRAELEKARKTYLPIFTAGEVARSVRSFGQYWYGQSREPNTVLTSSAGGPTSGPEDDSSGSPAETEAVPEGVIELEQVTKQEFGFSLGEMGEFVAEAVSLAWESHPGVTSLPREELVQRLAEKLGWQPADVSRLLQQLTLQPRESFLQPEPPFRMQDVYPWVYNRRLSYLRRPFVSRERDGITEILWGPRQVRAAWDYLANLCMSGRLKAATPVMQKFLGKLNNKHGASFNEEVYRFFNGIPGLIVRRKVDKIPGIKYPADLGDIDVLVVDVSRRLVRLIECKDLAIARTPQELQNEYHSMFVGDERKPSTIRKQQLRTRWFTQHLNDVLGWLRVDSRERWLVEPLIVTDVELMTPYMHEPGVPVLSMEQLRQQGDPMARRRKQEVRKKKRKR